VPSTNKLIIFGSISSRLGKKAFKTPFKDSAIAKASSGVSDISGHEYFAAGIFDIPIKGAVKNLEISGVGVFYNSIF